MAGVVFREAADAVVGQKLLGIDEPLQNPAELIAVEDRQNEAEQHQQRALEELHIGGRDHAGGDDDDDHGRADDDHAPVMFQPQQRLDQRPRADHLRNEVEN